MSPVKGCLWKSLTHYEEESTSPDSLTCYLPVGQSTYHPVSSLPANLPLCQFVWPKPYLEEGGADEGLFLVDGRCAEDIARAQVQRDVLNHVGQKLEVVNVADEVEAVHLRETHKDILRRSRQWSWTTFETIQKWENCDSSYVAAQELCILMYTHYEVGESGIW